jgi:hypothetical protein
MIFLLSEKNYITKSVCAETCCGGDDEVYAKPATKKYQEWKNDTVKTKRNSCKNIIFFKKILRTLQS